jgi:hypothetical protein
MIITADDMFNTIVTFIISVPLTLYHLNLDWVRRILKFIRGHRVLKVIQLNFRVAVQVALLDWGRFCSIPTNSSLLLLLFILVHISILKLSWI